MLGVFVFGGEFAMIGESRNEVANDVVQEDDDEEEAGS